MRHQYSYSRAVLGTEASTAYLSSSVKLYELGNGSIIQRGVCPTANSSGQPSRASKLRPQKFLKCKI